MQQIILRIARWLISYVPGYHIEYSIISRKERRRQKKKYRRE